MSLEGRLEEFSLQGIIDLLRNEGKTGFLTLEANGKWGTLYFKHGRIIYADRKKIDDRLKELLKGEEVEYSQEDIEEVLDILFGWESGYFGFK